MFSNPNLLTEFLNHWKKVNRSVWNLKPVIKATFPCKETKLLVVADESISIRGHFLLIYWLKFKFLHFKWLTLRWITNSNYKHHFSHSEIPKGTKFEISNGGTKFNSEIPIPNGTKSEFLELEIWNWIFILVRFNLKHFRMKEDEHAKILI